MYLQLKVIAASGDETIVDMLEKRYEELRALETPLWISLVGM
jgi:hypothetical protein